MIFGVFQEITKIVFLHVFCYILEF